MGSLPQGAPTSPMLANLAVRNMDEALSRCASEIGVRYTRYADDLTFSTTDKAFGRARAKQLIGLVYRAISERGMSANLAKTSISSPGSRKVVLGLLVDGETPRLTRRFKHNLRMHLHYICHPKFGPAKHAATRGFASVEGLRQHLLGLIAHASQIEPAYAASAKEAFRRAKWGETLDSKNVKGLQYPCP